MIRGFLQRRAFLAGIAALGALAAVQAHAGQRVVVPTQVIYPGETIYAGALKQMLLNRRKRHMPNVARTPEELDGMVARRTLLPGRMISLSWIREPYLVERGTEATAVFANNGLVISIQAVPQESGGAGDLIKMRNPASGTFFTGTVMNDGTVKVSAR